MNRLSWYATLFAMLSSQACSEGRTVRPSNPSRPPLDGAVLQGDARAHDAESFDGAASDLGGGSFDASALDAAQRDGQAPPEPDAGFDAGSIADAGMVWPDSGPPPGTVQLTTSGCSADFGGDLVVSYNGSIAVGSLRGVMLAASLQFDLGGQTGTIQLSSQHRIQTGLVVNLVTFSTWTNIAQDPLVITGQRPDPITGTLVVRSYQPGQGIMDIELQNVTLQNPSDLSFCTIDGTVQTARLGR